MEQLNKTPTTGKFGDVAKTIDTNFGLIVTKLMELSEASKAKEMNCGFYSSETELKTAYPNPDKGMMAYVGSGTDYTVYRCKTDGTWTATSETFKVNISVDLSTYATKDALAQVKGSVDNLLLGAVYGGIAAITTNPGTPKTKVFYLPTEVGEYPNFGNLSVVENEIAFLYYDGTNWTKQSVDFSNDFNDINDKLSGLSNKTKDISSDNEALGNIDEIDFCDDEDNVVHSIGKDSASFKNLKSNGQDVLTAKDIQGKADKDKSIIVQKESLNAGDEITLEENHIHSCKRIMFTANINSVGTIEVGVGKKEYWASWFEITETNISLKSYLTSEYNPNISFAHGLTLKNNIQFIIDVDDKGNVDLRLTSSGNSYVGHISVDNDASKTVHNWLGVNGKIRATSVSASLSDCTLSFTCDGYYKEIQVYGDSYIHVLNERRAYYYLAQNGYNRNIMLNAFPGEASKQALADLKLNLKYSAPKRILWAMGMNDLDVNETTPSKNWLDSVNEFFSICKENNIIPILATIPSVVGGYSEDSGIGDKRIHKAKNDWVKSSGYRYVDFAKAVGANDVTGYWFNNGESDDMLESGSMRVYPTKYGAVALYNQLITDFPEILMK